MNISINTDILKDAIKAGISLIKEYPVPAAIIAVSGFTATVDYVEKRRKEKEATKMCESLLEILGVVKLAEIQEARKNEQVAENAQKENMSEPSCGLDLTKPHDNVEFETLNRLISGRL